MFIGETLDVGFAGDAERSAFGARTREETFPLGIRSHIAPEGFAEQLAHGAVFARGYLLGLDEEVGRQSDRDGLGGAHSGHCKTLTDNVKQGAPFTLDGRAFAEKSGFGLSCCGYGLRGCRAGATKLLPLQGDIGEKQGEGDASPHDGFVEGAIGSLFQSGDAEDYAHFEKDDGDRKAASHPLTMLLDFAVEDEREGDASGEHPQDRVGGGSGAERTGAAHALLEVLNVEAERSGDEDAGDIEASDDAMELGEALAEAVGELHGPEQEGAGAHQAVGQKPPLESSDVQPFGILGVDEEMLVMVENVSDHQADESEQKIFRAWPREARGH